MAMVGITEMRQTLTHLARQAWDFDEISVFINGGGISVYPNSRPNWRINFQSYVNGERRNAYQDAVDYLRGEAMLRNCRLDLSWEGTNDESDISPIGTL